MFGRLTGKKSDGAASTVNAQSSGSTSKLPVDANARKHSDEANNPSASPKHSKSKLFGGFGLGKSKNAAATVKSPVSPPPVGNNVKWLSLLNNITEQKFGQMGSLNRGWLLSALVIWFDIIVREPFWPCNWLCTHVWRIAHRYISLTICICESEKRRYFQQSIHIVSFCVWLQLFLAAVFLWYLIFTRFTLQLYCVCRICNTFSITNIRIQSNPQNWEMWLHTQSACDTPLLQIPHFWGLICIWSLQLASTYIWLSIL